MRNLATTRVRAPEFPHGLPWWNTGRTLTFNSDLKGRVVILDFWTYSCINCIHMSANLEQVEAHYKGRPVVIIGVHTNKFINESEPDQIRQAILRYHVTHPVVVDENHALWKRYGVSAWPTLVFIDAEGRVAGSVSGEISAEDIQAVVDALLREGEQKSLLATKSLMLRPELPVPSASGLSFPGKVTVDPATGLIYVADSGHHRILVADPSGRLTLTIGSGERGQADGPISEAQFNDPQGLALDPRRNHLYIADHGNHLIRRVNQGTQHVETVLGAGRQVFDREGGHRGREQGLNSPWDIVLVGDYLYIAMAGAHQIWRLDIHTLKGEPWAGSGRENLVDGPGFNANLAQPSGLTHLDPYIYFTDSEASALRRVALRGPAVDTLIGHGLFVFGDVEGTFGRARFQHPLGVASDGHQLYVADTYNHKIKQVDLEQRMVRTLAGTGKPGVGHTGGMLELNEPGGLAFSDGKLYIADTNNHRLVVFDLAAEQWHELVIRPADTLPSEPEGEGYPVHAEIGMADRQIILEIDPALVVGFHLNHLAPQTLVIEESSDGRPGPLFGGRQLQSTINIERFPITVSLPLPPEKPEAGEFFVDLTFATCTEQDQKLCKPEHRRWRVQWRRAVTAADRLRLVGGMIGVG